MEKIQKNLLSELCEKEDSFRRKYVLYSTYNYQKEQIYSAGGYT